MKETVTVQYIFINAFNFPLPFQFVRSYEVARTESFPLILKECLDVVQSELMFLLLSRLTGLKLHEDVEDSSSDEEDTEEARLDQNGKYEKNSFAMVKAAHIHLQ